MSRQSVLLGTTMCAVVLLAACSGPPRKEIDQAQQAIENARRAGAEQYAPEAFAAATAALQQSNEAVDQRDYRLALSRAVDASDRAQEAARAAADNKASARTQTETALNATNAAAMHLQARLKVAAGSARPDTRARSGTRHAQRGGRHFAKSALASCR
jgi:methionyl-tRNA synthetase